MNLILIWYDAARVWWARQLTNGTDHQVVASAPLKALEDLLVKTHGLTYTSGHLTRAHQAGRKVRAQSEQALDLLLEAQGRDGAEFNETYAAPLTRQLYGGQEP